MIFLYQTPWSRVVVEKLLVAQPVKKFLTPYGTLKVHYCVYNSTLSLFRARLIQSIPSHPVSLTPFSYYPPIYTYDFQVDSFLHVFLPKHCTHCSSPPHMPHDLPIHPP